MMEFMEMCHRCASGHVADSGRRWRHPPFVRNGPLAAFSSPGGTFREHLDEVHAVARITGAAAARVVVQSTKARRQPPRRWGWGIPLKNDHHRA